ncbi:MAG: YihA family ribosome biogenesis GTP-binding protein [Alphaproteobacteria bacterium]|nr:YihA family ribosome biogenesis GTP-binding protein [Alphaproteobacteria bacterium]
MTTQSENDEAARLEHGRKLFAQECTFFFGAVTFEGLPEAGRPEIAFAGRSNVGKSSLVNALTGRKTLARVSATPGRTQQLNFFDLGGRLVLVDLPGYGYNQAGKEKAQMWGHAVRAFLKNRPTLRRVCLLVDARHGLNRHDRETMRALDQAAVNYQAVMTKADKMKPEPLAEAVSALAKELKGHVAAHPDVIVTSAHDGTGIPALRAALAALAEGSPFR